MNAGPVTKVAQDLTAITVLADALEDEAEHQSDSSLMPGGLATVALAPVANLEAWEHQYHAREHAGRDVSHVVDEDDGWEPPLQLLCFWSEAWRVEHGAEYGQRPTIASEANFIRWQLEWAWDHEPHFDNFASDIAKARRIMEDMLRDGERRQTGAPCLHCRRLLTRMEDAKGGLTDDWKCPGCHRFYDEQSYRNAVRAAYEATQAEVIGDTTWAVPTRAAQLVGRSVKTIREWVRQGKVAKACLIVGRRDVVCVDDVEELDETRQRRSNVA